MNAMPRPQGTVHAEHDRAQLATRFQDWHHRRTICAAQKSEFPIVPHEMLIDCRQCLDRSPRPNVHCFLHTSTPCAGECIVFVS
jgi:hypothetical protein